METTRHFTATAYVVHDGATVLHRHPRLDLWLPPGGHIQRDELPHAAAVREAREETGLPVVLLHEAEGVASDTARPVPEPATIMLEDINVHDGSVGHQHVDFIYYARAGHRQLAPEDGEVDTDGWEWFTRRATEDDPRLEPDVRAQAKAAIDAAGQ